MCLRQDSATTREVFTECTLSARHCSGHDGTPRAFARTERVFRGVKGGQRFAASAANAHLPPLGLPPPRGPAQPQCPWRPPVCGPRPLHSLPLRPQTLIPFPSSGSLFLLGSQLGGTSTRRRPRSARVGSGPACSPRHASRNPRDYPRPTLPEDHAAVSVTVLTHRATTVRVLVPLPSETSSSRKAGPMSLSHCPPSVQTRLRAKV